MSSDGKQPFIGSQAFVKETETYVTFSSKADAILASLQLFHNVPCRYMDLVFSVANHPEFNASQLTLRNSTDIVDIVEESQMKDRMAVVHKRSLGDNGRMEQAGFPQFVLDEVLDIIHAERMSSIRSRFKESTRASAMYSLTRIEEEDILKEMSLVHRTWTFPSQRALGRALYLGRPAGDVDIALPHLQNPIFGPWTSVVAVQLYHNIRRYGYHGYDYSCDNSREDYCQWFESLHRILVSFTNLKSVLIQSYAPFFTEWFNFTIGELVRRNTYLEEITLHTERYRMKKPFILDSLIKNSGRPEYLKTLNIEGARFSDYGKGRAMQGMGVGSLKNLTLVRSCSSFSGDGIDLETLLNLCTLSKSCLETLRYNGDLTPGSYFESEIARVSIPTQCAVAFTQLRSLHIVDNATADEWLKWIGPYCSSLENMALNTGSTLSTKALPLIPTSTRSLELRVLLTRWLRAVEVAEWIKRILQIFSSGRFSGLKSFSLYLSGLEALESDESRKQEIQIVLSHLHEFEESMRYLCRNAGVECFLHF